MEVAGVCGFLWVVLLKVWSGITQESQFLVPPADLQSQNSDRTNSLSDSDALRGRWEPLGKS